MKNKGKKIFIGYLVVLMILLSSLHSPLLVKVRGDSNYSNYLSSESISVKNDKALILYENSGSSNNYRNYYETGFLFPSKLRNEMYSTELTTNPAKYYFQQSYLNNLDNEYAFSDIDNLGQYETNSFVENYTDIIENNGYYESSTKESYFIPLIPNENIQNEPETYLNYSLIDDYGIADDGEWVAFSWLPERKLQYGFTDYNFTEFNSDIIKISVYYEIYTAGGQQYPNNKIRTWLTSNGTYNEYYDFDLSTIWTTYYITHDFYQFNNDLTFDNLTIQLDMVLGQSISHIKKACLKIYVNQTSKILGSNDYNYYNYLTEGAGDSGLFNAEYTFTDEIVGNPPSSPWNIIGASHTIISELDGHSKVLQCNDISGTTKTAEVPFTSALTGSAEYWMRVSDDSKRMYWQLTDTANNGVILCTIAGDLKYFNGVSWVLICAINNNQWYHHRVVWDSNSDTFDLYVDLIQEGNDLSYNSGIGGITKFRQISYSDSGYLAWTDAVDFSFSDGYFENRNYDDASFELNISSELQIELSGNDFDNLESLKLEYTVKGNSTCNLDLYLYNINSEIYDLVSTESITTSFQEFSYIFDLNYTYYNALGNTNFTFYIESSYDSLISIDKINLNSVFSNFSLNNEGYHNIDISFNRKTSGGTNRGNISLNLQLYKTYFTYDYIENNVIETDYSKLNQIVNFSNDLLEPLIECEIQTHIRYGLNTLDIDIVNVYYLIILNYNYTFELYEQLRFGNNDGNYFRYEFSYSAYNFNRLNNTGIFGNYSMNCLSGLRVLRGSTDINYNRYFLIPYFDEKISLTYTNPISQSGLGSEPRQPSGSYWSYETFQLSEYGNSIITVENWSVDYTLVYAEKYEAKFFYKEKTIKRRDLGDWSFKIGEVKVSFNFIRNALTDIINLIFLFFQYLFFLVTASLSYIFMYLGINILVLIWNILVYYVFIALIWILWYLYSALYYLFLMLYALAVYVYEVILIPFMYWLWEVAIPWIIDFLIIILAHIITIVIWLITLGEADYDTIYDNVYKMLRYIVDEIIGMLTTFVEHLDYVLLFILYYLLLTGMLYVRYLYVKARGFNNRAEQLYSAFEVFVIPIMFTLYLFKTTKDLVDPYTS